jgi:broad specificity phosphatase PhoE
MSARIRNGWTHGLLLALLLGGCAPLPVVDRVEDPRSATTTTFLVVRHAEKANDGSADPTLTAAGQARAQALAARLRGQPVRAAYATAYRRTQETALPTAQAHGLRVTTYDARMDVQAFAAQLRRDHGAGQVLVVGHSNTAPQIAAALCGCDVAPMAETEFDRLMTVRADANGHAELHEERY